MTNPRPNRWREILDQSAASFLASQLEDPNTEAEPGEHAGALIGRYRLIEEIGRGGMGVVWLAERADGQFEQRVALKLVKRGMDTNEIVARFLRERQILARLEHPHIARLLDGGVAEDDRPYFVMEFIDGEPITAYCDKRRLTIDDRLRLFIVACRTVQFAHQSLVVHRDLKPSNVLVMHPGQLKLLDFGIARMVVGDGDSDTAIPRAPMTPGYASPEQLAGEPVTTASDIYQLGVLLYELLCGHRPPPVEQSAGLPTDAPRPSVSAISIDPGIVSANRSTTNQRLVRSLKGDLDSIALACLRREAEQRPRSADAIADEVERHLGGFPVQLREGEFSYHASRFVRRHRARVFAGSFAAALALGSAAFYAVRIRRERDAALAETTKLAQGADLVRRMFADWSPDAANRGQVSAATILRNAARNVETEMRDRPVMLASSLSMIGELYTSIGEVSAADSLLSRALVMQQRAGPPADRAATLARMGRLFTLTSDVDKAASSLREALDLYRNIFGARRIETLRVQRDLAVHLRLIGNWSEAERLLRGVSDAMEGADLGSSFALEVDSELGYTLFGQARYEEAIALLRPTLERQRATLGSQNASLGTTIRYLASSYRDQGKLQEALLLYREALELTRTLYGTRHLQTAIAQGALSILLERVENLEEAERLTRDVLSILPSNYRIRPLELIHLGGIRLDRGDAVEAERYLRLGLDSLRRAFPSGNADEGDALNRLAYILASRGAGDAVRIYREAVAFHRARRPRSAVFVSDGLHFLAWAQRQNHDFSAAESTYRQALALYEAQLPPRHAYRRASQQGLEEILRTRR